MDKYSIFTKTAKGLGETLGKTRNLSREQRKILKEIDGNASLGDLVEQIGMDENKLEAAINKLLAEDYIREFASAAPAAAGVGGETVFGLTIPAKIEDANSQLTIGDFFRAMEQPESEDASLDFRNLPQPEAAAAQSAREDTTAQVESARRAIEEEARRITEQAQQQAVEAARQQAEQETMRAAEEAARREAKEHARREAEEQAKKVAHEQARIKAKEAVRRAAEELAQREAQAQARAEAERQARLRAEEAARLAAEEQALREVKEEARKLAEEQARRQADEQMRLQAQEQARLAAEEEARRVAQAEAKKADQERARLAAEESARIKAAEKTRQKAEEKARREAEAQARHAAKELARQAKAAATHLKAEEAARLKMARRAETEAKKEAEKQAQQATARAEKAAPAATGGEKVIMPVNPGKLVRLAALALAVLATVGLGLLHVIPFNGRLAALEQAASAQFGQPVKIGSMHLALFPQPHWRLQQVTVGSEGQIVVRQVDAGAEIGSLFSAPVQFRRIKLLSPVVNDEGLGWLLFGQSRSPAWQLTSLRASDMQLRSRHVQLPAFHVDAEIGADGGWRKIVLDATGSEMRLELQRAAGALGFEMTARALVLPFGGALTFDTFNASGTVRPDALEVSKFNAVLHDGMLSGTGSLSWQGGWKLKGEAQARQFNTAKLMPALMQIGSLDGNFKYAMQADEAGKLFSAPQARGSFNIGNGVLLGVDLASLVMGQAGSGKSAFNAVSGDFTFADGKTQLSRMRLSAGLLSAAGDASADASGKLGGRYAIDLRTASRQAHANLNVTGTLAAPQLGR